MDDSADEIFATVRAATAALYPGARHPSGCACGVCLVERHRAAGKTPEPYPESRIPETAMPRFTPGPWARIREDLQGGRYWSVQIPGGEEIDQHEMDNGEANTALIAAATELYEALQFIFEHITDKERRPADLYPAFGLDARRAIEMAGAALAKARGEA